MTTPTSSAGSLTTVADVKRLLRLSNELTDAEIGSYIADTSREIYQEYGWPIANVNTVIDKDLRTYYIFPWNQQGISVFSIDRVMIDGSILHTASWTGSPNDGTVTLASTLPAAYENKDLYVGFTPMIIKQLATFMVSFDIIQSQFVISGEGGEFPRTSWIKQRIDELRAKLIDGVYMTSPYKNYVHYHGDYVYQDDIGSPI